MTATNDDRMICSPALQDAGRRLGAIADRAADAIEGNFGVDIQQLANGLGWFGVARGVLEILGPRSLRKNLGLGRGPGERELFGLREIVTGVGILRGKNKAAWLWGRVGGDVLDLTALASESRSKNRQPVKLLAATAAAAAITALDAICARRLSR
jgi:hypothetical protein